MYILILRFMLKKLFILINFYYLLVILFKKILIINGVFINIYIKN